MESYFMNIPPDDDFNKFIHIISSFGQDVIETVTSVGNL